MMKNYFNTIFLFFSFLALLNSQTLCEQYENVPIDTIINNDNASDWENFDFNGKHVLFEGPLNLDTDIDFTGAILRLDGGRMFPSAYNTTVKFNNCKVYAPCNEDFTFLIGSSQFHGLNLIVYNSRFEDFVELFHIESPGRIDIFNSEFIRTEVLIGAGIGHAFHILDFYGDNSIQDDFRFRGNYFNASSGIWLDDVSGVTISNNTFEDCEHAGVYFVHASSKILIEGSTFNNCKVGIDANNQAIFDYLIAHNNIFVNVETAFENVFSENVYLVGNEMTNNQIAGKKFLNARNSNYFLFNNTIDNSHINGLGKSAFSINGGGTVNAKFNVYNSTKSSFLFDISGVSKVEAIDNNSIGGIVYLQGVDELNLYDNEVNAIYSKFAFRSDMSNGRFCKNKGINASKVFSFRGNCMNTDFTNNEVGHPFTFTTGTGLFVDDVIGQQEHKANLWNASFSTEGATNTSGLPFFSLITVNSDPNQGGNPLFIPQGDSYSPSNWFDRDFATTSFANCLSSNFTNSGGSGNQMPFVDRQVVKGLFNTTPLSNWLAVRNVIRKLIQYPSLLNDTEVNTWYQAQQGLAVYTVSVIEEELSDYYGTSIEVEDIRVLLDDFVLLTDALSGLNSGDPGYQDAVDDKDQVMDDLHVIQSTIDTRQLTILSQVNSMLSSMSSTNDYESLFEDIYGIHVKYLQDDTYDLTSNEIHSISEAANLCPLTYGPSIYVSRSLADHYKIPYDEENCSDIRTRSSKKEDKKGSDFIIYPNPSSNILNVKSSTVIHEVRLYDTRMNLRLITNESSIDISTIQPGIYICEAYGVNEMIGRQKIVVLK